MVKAKELINNLTDIHGLVRHFMAGGLYRRLSIQLTTACEARCQQCQYGSRSSDRSTLAKEKVLEAIKHAADNDFFLLSFTGGEPFLFVDDLLDYIYVAGQLGVRRIYTGTNAGFLQRLYAKLGDTKEYCIEVQKIAKRIVDSPLTSLWISVDSSDVATHENNRGLPNVIHAIEAALPVFHQAGIFPAANMGIGRLIDGPCPAWETQGFHSQGKFDKDRFYRRCH